MRAMVTFEHRFIRTPNGDVYTRGTVDYSFLSRYLAVFDEVVVLARMEGVDEVPSSKKRADGPNVSFFPLPYYVGPIQFLKHYREVKAKVKGAVSTADAYILRVGGAVGTLLWRNLLKSGRPYGVEVVADPWDVFAPDVVKSVFSPILRRTMRWQLVKQCQYASVASYVTEHTLQKSYPSRCWSTHYSTIDLPPETILDESVVGRRMKRIEEKISAGNPLRLCFAGSMAQLYKAPDILISAVANCIKKGINLELIMLGDGIYRPQLEEQTEMLGVAEKIQFLGNVPPREAVYDQLDQADLFVLASRTEGLPRSIIEAMARGLPCIGSTAGGIPELLDEEYIVQPGMIEPLTRKIEEVLGDKEKLQKMSRRNLEKAREYCIDKLAKRREEFYQRLATITQIWRSKVNKGKNERT